MYNSNHVYTYCELKIQFMRTSLAVYVVFTNLAKVNTIKRLFIPITPVYLYVIRKPLPYLLRLFIEAKIKRQILFICRICSRVARESALLK